MNKKIEEDLIEKAEEEWKKSGILVFPSISPFMGTYNDIKKKEKIREEVIDSWVDFITTTDE